MNQLDTCRHCGGFTPAQAARCPHCEKALPVSRARWVGGILATGAAGLAAFTLQACYGIIAMCTAPDGGTEPCPPCTLSDGGKIQGCYEPVDAGEDAGTDAGTGADAGDGGH